MLNVSVVQCHLPRAADAGRWAAAVVVAPATGAARPAVAAGETPVARRRRHARAHARAPSVPPVRPWPQGKRRGCAHGGMAARAAWPRPCRPPGGGRRGSVGGARTAACPRPAPRPVGAARPSVATGEQSVAPPGGMPAPLPRPVGAARPSGAAGDASVARARRHARARRMAWSVRAARPCATTPRRPTKHAADRRNRGEFAVSVCADRPRAPDRRSAGRLMRAVGRQPISPRRRERLDEPATIAVAYQDTVLRLKEDYDYTLTR
jgi:hypothetical protein